MSDDPCFAYVICRVRGDQYTGPVKIGISRSPNARLAQLQTGSPYKLALSACLLLSSRDEARAVERLQHEYHAEHAMAGEWFDIDPFTATGDIVGTIVEQAGFRLARPEDIRRPAQ